MRSLREMSVCRNLSRPVIAQDRPSTKTYYASFQQGSGEKQRINKDNCGCVCETTEREGQRAAFIAKAWTAFCSEPEKVSTPVGRREKTGSIKGLDTPRRKESRALLRLYGLIFLAQTFNEFMHRNNGIDPVDIGPTEGKALFQPSTHGV